MEPVPVQMRAPLVEPVDNDWMKKIPLPAFCKLLEKIGASGGRKKKELIQKLLLEYRQAGAFFPMMRLLLPQILFEKKKKKLDKERIYGLKELTIAKLYVEILGIEKTSRDALRLLEWKKPPSVTSKTTASEKKEAVSGVRDIYGAFGDFGTAVYLSLQNRSPGEGTLTLLDLDVSLTQLCVAQDRTSKAAVLKNLLFHTTALEQKWIVRIILKGLIE